MLNAKTPAQISAVVCSLNEEARIVHCLSSLKEAGVGEIILVDGHSTDKTVEVASKYADKIVFDDGKGLGAARNLGIAESEKTFILNFGADNSIKREALQLMLNDLDAYQGVSCLTSKVGSNYLNRCMNIYRYLRYQHGPVTTIGTPSLFRHKTLQKYKFDNTRKGSDDSELCDRIRELAGGTFYISEATCFEHGHETWNSVKFRWKNLYGGSDFEIYEANKSRWSLLRRLKSIFYPLRKEFFIVVLRIRKIKELEIIPFLMFITFWRYVGWIKSKCLKMAKT